tara:strand:+ start:2886 stop:3560 length:675 start_codon:yes stop_codon:yes gene_type:complete
MPDEVASTQTTCENEQEDLWYEVAREDLVEILRVIEKQLSVLRHDLEKADVAREAFTAAIAFIRDCAKEETLVPLLEGQKGKPDRVIEDYELVYGILTHRKKRASRKQAASTSSPQKIVPKLQVMIQKRQDEIQKRQDERIQALLASKNYDKKDDRSLIEIAATAIGVNLSYNQVTTLLSEVGAARRAQALAGLRHEISGSTVKGRIKDRHTRSPNFVTGRESD